MHFYVLFPVKMSSQNHPNENRYLEKNVPKFLLFLILYAIFNVLFCVPAPFCFLQ